MASDSTVMYTLPKDKHNRRRAETMTRFEKDLQTAKTDIDELDFILRDRKAELDRLWEKGKAEKNGFRQTCIAQEYTRLKAQYDELSEYI